MPYRINHNSSIRNQRLIFNLSCINTIFLKKLRKRFHRINISLIWWCLNYNHLLPNQNLITLFFKTLFFFNYNCYTLLCKFFIIKALFICYSLYNFIIIIIPSLDLTLFYIKFWTRLWDRKIWMLIILMFWRRKYYWTIYEGDKYEGD